MCLTTSNTEVFLITTSNLGDIFYVFDYLSAIGIETLDTGSIGDQEISMIIFSMSHKMIIGRTLNAITVIVSNDLKCYKYCQLVGMPFSSRNRIIGLIINALRPRGGSNIYTIFYSVLY